MEEDELLYREMNPEDDFYMGDKECDCDEEVDDLDYQPLQFKNEAPGNKMPRLTFAIFCVLMGIFPTFHLIISSLVPSLWIGKNRKS